MARGARYSRTLLGRRSSSFTLILAALLTASVVLPMLLGFGVFSLPVGSDDRAKPDLRPLRSVHEAFCRKDDMGQIGDQWTEVLSWEPRAFIYHKFLSKKECDYLIELAKPHMEKSTVVDSATGWSKDSRVRTSSSMFLRRGKDKIICAIEKRIADYTFIPVGSIQHIIQTEELHHWVLHYEVGQKYDPHYDSFHDEFNTKNGGQRIATLLMYLISVAQFSC
ncbi:probable prolyl 4-hydroxylase 3 isoform X3 [Musa acuminata AAA Group]|uniref:probable prolyl 4-hydroxylase 3 isoform X3 n=1 Tax=Musa acuminata AAA Group TaxID=214697 RepID=UPI0031E19143